MTSSKLVKLPYQGSINLHIGPMFSSKTSILYDEYVRYSIGNKQCLMIKHEFDTRYNNTIVTTHDRKYENNETFTDVIPDQNNVTVTKIANNITLNTFKCRYLYEADSIISNYDAVFIDELQFYDDAHIFCDKWANEGLIIQAVGLNGTFERKEFSSITKLIPLVESIEKRTAICRETGNDASYSVRTSDDDETVMIAGTDKYKPADRLTYFNEMTQNGRLKYELNNFRDFIEIYSKSKGIHLNIPDNIIIEFILKEMGYASENSKVINYVRILQDYLMDAK